MKHMMDASEWTWARSTSTDTSHLIELKNGDLVEVEVRCQKGAVLNVVTMDGQIVFLDQGSAIRFFGRLSGFAALEVATGEEFSYRCRLRRYDEPIDPTPVQITVSQTIDPVQLAIREEMKRYLARLETDKLLADDASVEELMDDIESGDLEFEPEADPWGLGYEDPDSPPEGVSGPAGGPDSDKGEVIAPSPSPASAGSAEASDGGTR